MNNSHIPLSLIYPRTFPFSFTTVCSFHYLKASTFPVRWNISVNLAELNNFSYICGYAELNLFKFDQSC